MQREQFLPVVLEHAYDGICVATNTVIGAEALMRWDRPGHGDISPSVFIPLAEESGLITQLGSWSVRRACQDAVTWPEPLQVAVNVSARHLTDAHIVETVRAALAETGLSAERLCAEVTETAVFADVPAAAEHLRALAALGVKISLDDFGTGYSSLAYLRDFSVDSFKRDRSFVAGLGRNTDDFAIMVTLLNLAASLDPMVVAEGIETLGQLAQLRQLGCPRGQGYVWSGAMTAMDFATAIETIERPWPPMGVSAAREGSGLVVSVDPAIRRRIVALHRRGTSRLPSRPRSTGKAYRHPCEAAGIATRLPGPSPTCLSALRPGSYLGLSDCCTSGLKQVATGRRNSG